MADSNKYRAGRAKVELLLPPDEGDLLERVATAMGESKVTLIRAALRPYLRKRAKELGLEIRPRPGDGSCSWHVMTATHECKECHKVRLCAGCHAAGAYCEACKGDE